ncbi:uncharacterized protein LOC134832739 [Culicoides brevitarsis]|uniref:uncharacterized protein LOC134832739 n=1 Tax=Culicoides brevitarsis TaxID=469753 RepID=UPI00307B5B86
MENHKKSEKSGSEAGVSQVKRHSLTQLKLPNKGSGTEFSDKSSTPKTPTPTRTVDRLLRNCDAIGLFEELKHVNPFDETFRKAVENKDVTFLSSAPLKGLTPEDELNTPQYPSLLKDKATDQKPSEKPKTERPKNRKLLKMTNSNVSKVIRPILPKPSSSAKAKLKAFILKDLSPVIVEKIKDEKKLKIIKNKSPKPTDSNREAAKRYRQRVKLLQEQLEEDNLRLRRENSELLKENLALKRQILMLTNKNSTETGEI